MEMAEIIEALHHEDEVQEAWEERDQTLSALHRSSSIVSLSNDNEENVALQSGDEDGEEYALHIKIP